jgi:signal peptidase I
MLTEQLQKWYAQIAIILGTLFLFIITKNIFFGIAIVLEIFIFVGLEVRQGATKHGWKNEIIDTLIAFGIALGFWIFLCIVLQTSSPISAVVSCSMLPNLERGDFVIVQGTQIKAEEIAMTKEEFDDFSKTTVTVNNGAVMKGSLYANCFGLSPKGELLISTNQTCHDFYLNPSKYYERKGPVTIYYSSCSLKTADGNINVPCVKEYEFKGKKYAVNHDGDITVYQPRAEDIYSRIGDIVHRTQFIINVEGEKYYVTKGDNNQIFDVQMYAYGMGNTPAKNLKGKVLFRIPYLGYLKLFISGMFFEDGQCKTLLGN